MGGVVSLTTYMVDRACKMDDRYYLQGMEIFSASQLVLFISLSLRAEESVEVDSDDDYPYDEVSLDQ